MLIYTIFISILCVLQGLSLNIDLYIYIFVDVSCVLCCVVLCCVVLLCCVACEWKAISKVYKKLNSREKICTVTAIFEH